MSDNKGLEAKIEKWRERGEKRTVNVFAPDGTKVDGTLYIHTWTKSERVRRAFTWLMAFWVLAAFCVFIPVLHFLLVPGFFVIGPFIAYGVYQQTETVLGGYGQCPRCHEDLPLVGGKAEWPLRDLCTHCHAAIKIAPPEIASEPAPSAAT